SGDRVFYPSNGSTPETVTLPTMGVGTFSISDVTALEGDSGTTTFAFTVTRTGGGASSSTVDYATADGTAKTSSSDYQAKTGTLLFTSDGSQTVSINVSGNIVNSLDKTFFVNLTGAVNAMIDKAQGVGMIQNDDATGASALFKGVQRGTVAMS